jgi:peptidoglycan/xylan/chitin deacetylase (PgdA/CDA1 family)
MPAVIKIRLITWIKVLMIPLGALIASVKRTDPIIILMYHRVNDLVHKEISVTKKDFRWQMEYLRKRGYRVISLDQAIELSLHQSAGYTTPGAKAGKYVVLSFDDGYQDFYTTASPILSVYGYPSIVYLVPGYMDTGKVFWWDRDLGKSDLMSWKDVKELISNPLVGFGSHSLTHPDLDQLDRRQIDQELGSSKRILEEQLSRQVRHFAYPRGIVTDEAKELVRVHYETGLSIFDGAEISKSLMQIKRLPVQRSDGRFLFGPRLRGWLAPEEWIKKRLGRR